MLVFLYYFNLNRFSCLEELIFFSSAQMNQCVRVINTELSLLKTAIDHFSLSVSILKCRARHRQQLITLEKKQQNPLCFHQVALSQHLQQDKCLMCLHHTRRMAFYRYDHVR